jgi:membrane-bound lytic murein transglycosylase D
VDRKKKGSREGESAASGRKSGKGAPAYSLSAIVLVVLLIAAIDRAAENSKVVFASPDLSGAAALPPAPKTPTPRPMPTATTAAAAPVSTTFRNEVPPAITPSPAPSESDVWSYFHPMWQTSFAPSIDGLNALSPAAAQTEDLMRYLDDPERRLEPAFRVPRAMRERVFFWMQIHARFDTRMRVLHDRNHPWLVYGYADFSSVYRTAASRAQGDARAYRLELKVIHELKTRLSEAAGLTNTHLLSPWEKAQLRSWFSRSGALSPDAAARLISAIRSQTGQRDEFLAALARSEKLLPYIEMEFRLQSLPAALGHIPFVESSFNWHAHSKVGAMGIWQFMPETARQMIGGDPSRWADPIRQTRGAVKLFQIYRTMLPDWSTAITSYNSGAGRLKHLVEKYRTHSVVKLLDVSDGESLGFAGKNFYAQFLSVNLMEAYRKEVFPELRREEQNEDLLAFHHVTPFAREFRDQRVF